MKNEPVEDYDNVVMICMYLEVLCAIDGFLSDLTIITQLQSSLNND